MSGTRAPETSIVIRAYNEERWLPEVLKAIEGQRYRDYEVVVVDSGSVDRTRDIAAAAGARIVRMRKEDFTFGHSLNVGIREARGKFIAIVSAHAIPSDERWLERLIAPFRDPEVAMVFGRQRGHAISKFSEARDFERIFPDKLQEMDDEHLFANNANSAVRRDLWENHPFDEGVPGLEDIEWAKHWLYDARMKAVYEPKACIIHVHDESWPQVQHRYHREGIAGRWISYRITRQIPLEIGRELWWCAGDLVAATLRLRLLSLAGEILRFRYYKTLGIVQGILDSRSLDNPSRREEPLMNTAFPAVVIRGPHRASLEQRWIPSLKPGEILVRVAYQGICATDLEILEGRLGYYKNGMAKYPIVPGHETSGTVASLGKKVEGLKEGDRVVVECIQGCGECEECLRDAAITCHARREVGVFGHDGGYAAYVVSRARFAHRVPDNVSRPEAALAEPLAVVMKGLRRLGATAAAAQPRRCAVVGAGAIGNLAAQVLALRGYEVTAFDRVSGRLSLLGGRMSTSESLTGLERFDWIVEATGNQSVLETVLKDSATGATLLLLGLPYGLHEFSFESIVGFDKTVIGSVGSNGGDFREALNTLPLLDKAAFLTARYPVEDFEQAWDAVRSRVHLKVMLVADPIAA